MNILDSEMETPKLYSRRSLGQSLDPKSPSVTRSKLVKGFTRRIDKGLNSKAP